MMKDRFEKVIFVGILICLIVIAVKPEMSKETNAPQIIGTTSVADNQLAISLGDNRIGIIDSWGIKTGKPNRILVFRYDQNQKEFIYESVLDTEYVFDHPDEYGIPY